jgi:hypothetical protein
VLDEVGVTIPDVAAINGVAASNGRPGAPVENDIEQAKQQTLAIRLF